MVPDPYSESISYMHYEVLDVDADLDGSSVAG